MNKPGSLQSFLQKKWPLIVSILLFMAAVISYFVLPPVEQFINEAYNTLTSQDEERISDWVNELGIWGPSFIITSIVLQMFLLIVPSPLLMLVSILAYGPYWGSVLAIAAIFIASTVGYYVGKFLSYWTIQKLIGEKKKKKLAFYVNRYGFWAVVITRLSPFLSNDAISFVGGIVKMKYWKFIGATLLGIVPLTILFAWFGENNERLKTGLIWTVIVSILIFTVYVVYDRRKIKDHH